MAAVVIFSAVFGLVTNKETRDKRVKFSKVMGDKHTDRVYVNSWPLNND